MDGVAPEKILRIKALMENYKGYRFDREIEAMNEEQVNYVLSALASGKIERLLEKKVMIPVFRYRVSADADIWGYISFRETVGGKLIDYDSDGTHIFWQVWEVPNVIPEAVAKRHGFEIELLSTP